MVFRFVDFRINIGLVDDFPENVISCIDVGSSFVHSYESNHSFIVNDRGVSEYSKYKN